ncbi:DUF3558 family protein [Actinocrispum sp. NPDC049592]|uniref:DUF3558 family protein n=1 Tax=Actinocrispum sp. NPDC049592 TaxID=3154835 RepID=UPI00342A713F
MRWLWAALLVAALVISGCTSRVGGTAFPDPQARKPLPDSSVELIGNANTLDPCGLLDPAALAQFGTAQRQDQESYDYCVLRMPMSGANVAVRFGLLERINSVADLQARQNREVEPVGSLRVFEETPVPDRCARYIVFSDNVTLAVSADTVDSPNKTVSELCSVVEKSATVIAENVAAKKVTHRQYEPTSFGPLDACKAAVVSLSQIPGLAVADVNSYPAHHQCRWGGPTVPSLQVRYVLAEPSGASYVKHETIDGKQTGVYNVDITGRSLCVAELKGTGRELAQVVVRLAPNQADAACSAARIVAGEVWEKLPATS